jgi:hypothetical protein
MSAEALFLWAAALLFALGVAGGVFARERFAHPLVYGGALAMSAAMLVLALVGHCHVSRFYWLLLASEYGTSSTNPMG